MSGMEVDDEGENCGSGTGRYDDGGLLYDGYGGTMDSDGKCLALSAG